MDELQILVKAVLGEESRSTLDSELKSLVNGFKGLHKVQVGVELDNASVKTLQSQIQAITSKVGSSTSGKTSPAKLKVFDETQLKADGQRYFSSVQDVVTRAQAEFSKLGKVDVSVFKNASGEIESFSANVTKADGVVEKFNFTLAQIKQGANTIKGFVQTSSSLVDKNAGTNLENTLNYLNKIESKIADINSKTLKTSSKPLLEGMEQFDQYQAKLEETRASIDNILSNNETLSAEHKREIDSMISDLQRYASELQNTAYAGTDLSASTFAQEKAELQAALETNIAQWKNSGLFGPEFEASVNRAKASLDNATNPDQLKAYRSELKILKEEFAQLKAGKLSENNIIRGDTLEQNIKTAQLRIQNLKSTYSAFVQDPALLSRWQDLFDSSQMVSSQAELTNLNAKVRQFEQELISAGKHSKSMFGNLLDNASKMAQWMVLGTVVAGIMRGVRGLTEAVRDLDSAMVELKKVTDETDQAYEQFLSTAAEKSVKIGTAYSDFVNSTADFARLGYSMEDSTKLAEVANIYSVVGDEISGVDVATSSIISTMKAFGIEVDDTIGIVDKFNEVGNNFAISSGGIGDALTRSAAALADANNTIDQSIALVVAANNVIQDPDVVGTMWKTVAMRIRGAKTELEEAGLETEYMAESTAKLRDSIKGLTNVDGTGGFDIMLDEDTFKSTYDIILGISEVWEKMNDIDQAALLELLAGKRQGNALAAAITNMDDAVAALETSINSEGSALKEHERWMDSIQAKQKQFQAQYEVFANTLLNSNLMKFTYDAGTGILGFLTKLVDLLGGLQTIALGSGLVMFFKNFKDIKSFFTEISAANKALAMAEGIELSGLSKAGVYAKGAFTGLADAIGVSTTALAGFLGVLAAIGVSYVIYDKLVTTFDEAAEAADEARSKYEQTKSEIESVESELQRTGDRIDELNAKDGLTLVEQGELATLQATNEQLEKRLALLQQQEQLDAKAAAVAARNALTNEGFTAYGDSGEDVKRGFFWDIVNSIGKSMALSSASQMAAYDGGQTYELVKQNQAENVNIIETTIRKQNKLNQLQEEQNKILDHSSDEYIQIGDQIANLSGEISSNWSTIDQYKQSIIDAGLEDAAGFKEIVEQVEHLENLMLGFEIQDENGNWIETELGKRQKQIELAESFMSRPTLQSSFDNLRKALSIDNDMGLDEIIAKFPELASAAESAGVSIEDVINIIKSELGLLNFDEVREQLANALDVSNFTGASQGWIKEGWQSWLDDLPDSDIKILYGIYQSNDTSAWTFADWQDALNNAKTEAEEFKGTFEGLFKDLDGNDTDLAEKVNSYTSALSTLQSALEKISSGEMTSSDLLSLFDEFPELAGRTDDLDIAIQQLIDDMTGDVVSDLEAQMSTLASPEDRARLQAYIDTLKGLSDTDSFDAAIAKSNAVISSITAVQGVLSSAASGKTISIGDLNSDELKEYASALEYTNGGIQLNAEKVRELVAAKSDEQIALNNTNKAILQSKYIENARKIEDYRATLARMSDQESTQAQAIQETINALLSENGALETEIMQYDAMSEALRQATDAYHNWLNAQSSADYGDMYDDYTSAYQRIVDTFDEDSDIFGQVGSRKFEAAVEFVVPDTVDTTNAEAIQSYMNSLKQYMTFDDDGNVVGMDIERFCQNAVDAGLMVLDEASDSYKIAGEKTMEDFAEGLNLSVGVVESFFDQLKLYGGDFTFSADIETFGDLAVLANQSAEALHNMEQYSDLKFVVNVEGYEDADNAIWQLDKTIETMNGIKADVNVDPSSIEYANNIIQYCVAQKQLLTQPDVMSVDTTQVTGALGEALTLLQEYQQAANTLEVAEVTFGADSSQADEAKAHLDEVLGQIQGSEAFAEIGMEIDSTSQESVQAFIDGLTSQELVTQWKVDPSLVDNYAAEEKSSTGIVTWSNDSSRVDAYSRLRKSATGTVYWDNDITFVKTTFYATGKVNWENSSGPQGVNGTAHSSGTAKAGGDWGTAPGGKTLVGELGREIVVDPHTGRWYTVGDTGAEFVNIPKGSIVFNHKQTESLLRDGYVAGRAAALMSGTAMVGISGGISRKNAQNGSKTGTSGTGTASTSSSTSQATSTPTSYTATYINSVAQNTTAAASQSFEDLYKYHQHLLAMDQESVRDYLTWLSSAYKKAYSNAEIELDDFYKYEEEVYNKTKELFDDYLNDEEHRISLMERNNTDPNDIAQAYTNLMRSVHEQADLYRAMGLDDNSDYIQELQDKWWEYADEAKEALHSIYETAVKEHENTLSLLEHQYGVASDNMNRGKMMSNLQKQIEEQRRIQEEAHAEAERLRALGVDENDEAIQECINAWWGAHDRIKEINQQIVSDTLEIYDDFIKYADDYNIWNNLNLTKVDILNQKLTEINRLYEKGLLTLREYRDLLHETYLSIYQEQRDSLKTIIEMTEKLIRQEAEDHVDALKDQIDAYKKIIDLKKQSLATSKEQEKYDKEVSKRVSKIAEIQAKIAQLDRDDSRAANAEKQKLAKELAELQEDLADYQADYAYDAQVDALDKEATAFEDQKNDEIKLVQSTVDTEEKVYRAAIARIEGDWDQLYIDLMAWNSKYGDMIDGPDSITSAWNTAKSAAQEYGGVVQALNGIKERETEVANQQYRDQQIGNIVKEMHDNSNAWHTADEAGREQLNKRNLTLGAMLSQYGVNAIRDEKSGVWYVDKIGGEKLYDKYKSYIYHKGGTVGEKPGIFKNDEVPAILKKGESVFTEAQTNSLIDKIKTKGLGMVDSFVRLVTGRSFDAMGAVESVVNNNSNVDNSTGGDIHIENTFNMQDMSEESMKQYAKYYSDYTIDQLITAKKRRGLTNSVQSRMLR